MTCKQFPWHKIKPECGISYGGITGGVDYNPEIPHICFVGEDGFVEAWEIPGELAAMLEVYKKWGRSELAQNIRDLLYEGLY